MIRSALLLGCLAAAIDLSESVEAASYCQANDSNANCACPSGAPKKMLSAYIPAQGRRRRKHGGMPARYTCKYAGNCEHGTLVAETQRTQQGHCGTCDAGYRVVNKVCVAWEGSCANGELTALASRTEQNHCGSCNAGYVVNGNNDCEPKFNGGCQNGQDKPVSQRTAHNQCSACNNHDAYNGYVLVADEKCQRHCQANDSNANCACPSGAPKKMLSAYIPAQGRRRRKHGGMPARYTCKFEGNCEHGTLIADSQRTQHGHCGTCDDGYHLVNKVCVAWAGVCPSGSLLLPQSARTADNQCGSCLDTHVLSKRVLSSDNRRRRRKDNQMQYVYSATADTCIPKCGVKSTNPKCVCDTGVEKYSWTENGDVSFSDARRRRRRAGGAVTNTYAQLSFSKCVFKGVCANGNLIAPLERTQQNHCGSCNAGYGLENKACVAWHGECANGELVATQTARTQHHHCGTCDDGYYLENKACIAWGGECVGGTMRPQSARTAHNQCATCDDAHLHGTAVLSSDNRRRRRRAGGALTYTYSPDKDFCFPKCGVQHASPHCMCDAGTRRKSWTTSAGTFFECHQWGGTCPGGTLLMPKSARTADNQCGACNSGKHVFSKRTISSDSRRRRRRYNAVTYVYSAKKELCYPKCGDKSVNPNCVAQGSFTKSTFTEQGALTFSDARRRRRRAGGAVTNTYAQLTYYKAACPSGTCCPPTPACAAPQPGCHYAPNSDLDESGCPVHPCGVLQCPRVCSHTKCVFIELPHKIGQQAMTIMQVIHNNKESLCSRHETVTENGVTKKGQYVHHGSQAHCAKVNDKANPNYGKCMCHKLGFHPNGMPVNNFAGTVAGAQNSFFHTTTTTTMVPRVNPEATTTTTTTTTTYAQPSLTKAEYNTVSASHQPHDYSVGAHTRDGTQFDGHDGHVRD